MNSLFIATSAILSTAGIALASVTTDNITAWTISILNCIILVSNVALSLYRQWRDKDKDESDYSQINTITSKEDEDNEENLDT